jgi:small ligand-binding sensory domain FIST
VERSNEALVGLPIVGGVAYGPRSAGSTRLLIGDQVVERGAVGALLAGPVAARSMVSQGCRPVGPTMTVTAADGNVILALAGEPALTKLESIVTGLPPEDQALIGDGLQIGLVMNEYAEEHEQGDFLIRGVLGLDKPNEGIVVGDAVDVGTTVRFHVRDADAADTDLTAMLERLRTTSGFDTIEGALLFSCNGRGGAFFPTPDHDVVSVRSVLATDGVAGFFAAGEIGPVAGRNHVHGQSASVLAFGSGHEAARGTAGG